MNIKILGIIGFDVLVTLTPLLIDVSPELVDIVSYFLIGLSTITLMVLIGSEEYSDALVKIELEHRKKPCWWDTYDLASDGVFAFIWVVHGFYVVVLILIMVKIFIAIKIPNYYKGCLDG